jgi:protein-S-isoprenylcysteine O-methyltransferase Ste14
MTSRAQETIPERPIPAIVAAPVSGTAARRVGILAYGVASYLVGVAALVGLILAMLGVLAFTGGPIHIHSPGLGGLFNLGLLLAFALQHSLMARTAFKQRWIRIVGPSLERSTYVLATGVVLLPLLALWQPLPAVLWSVQTPIARALLTGLAVLGWAYLFAASFAINHFELFGLQQAWRGFHGQAPVAVPFRERWMYRFDRHPIMTGVLVGIWVTPEMTLGHLCFAAIASVYIAIGVHFEERALRRQWGETYEAYRRRVPTIVPLPWSRR